MIWDVVINAWLAVLNADAALTAALGAGGPHIYPASSARTVRIPSVEYILIGDLEEENFNAITVQVDIFALGPAKEAIIERRIRLLTHRDVARTLGAHRMWTRYLDSRTHDFPSQLGVHHRSLDFEFKPLKAKYALLT